MLEVIHEDDNLRVYNKPSDVSLLRDRSGASNLWAQIQQAGEKPYLVHRLDKGTSGVLLTARTQDAQRRLTSAFANEQVDKFYVARVVGAFPADGTLRIELPLCRGRKSRYRVAGQRETIRRHGRVVSVEPDREGLAAVTLARRLSGADSSSLLLLKPRTGRTHQLRVHLSWMGHPILGDHLYGTPDADAQRAPRLMLHCHRLVVHGWGSFTAPLPSAFEP